MKRTCIQAIFLCLLLAAEVPADIGAEILTVGFPGEGVEGAVYRGGAWAPVAVRLSLENEEARTVFVRLEQLDRDGDVVYTEKMVALTPDLKGPGTSHWLYYVPNPESGIGAKGLTIQVLDENHETVMVHHQGRRIRKLELVDLPDVLDERSFLVLSIGEGTAGKIRTLSDYGKEDDSKFKKLLRVSHISPDMIPDHWHGLEMVDAIVWDAADPTQLSPYQQEAIVEWVRHGGRLLIAASGTVDRLEKSRFDEFLPVDKCGVTARASLPNELAFGSWRVGRDQSKDELQYSRRLQVAECQVKEDARPLVQSPAKTQTFLATRELENGSITFLAVTLRDLFSEDGDVEAFFGNVLGLRKASLDLENRTGMYGFGKVVDLFDQLHEPIDFQKKIFAYLLVAMLFVIVYGLLATWGSWFMLRSRQLLKHSWTAFAVVSLGASVVSFGAVQTIRGIGRELHQLTIIDSTVDTYSATAHCFFGLKTSTYVQDMDLWLPVDSRATEELVRTASYLRPLSPRIGGMVDGSRFADTKRYRAEPGRAVLHDVPIRATLKQMEGYWRGRMEGQIHANIRLESSIIALGSTITNNLGHDLKDCFLIQAQLNLNWRGGSRGQSILVHPLGEIRDQETIDLHRWINNVPPDYTTPLPPDEVRTKRLLKNIQATWAKQIGKPILGGQFTRDPFKSIVDYQLAIMLMTTFSEFEPELDTGAVYGSRRELIPTNSRWLDRSNVIDRDTLLLVGFAEDPGPVRLFGRRGRKEFRSIRPDQGFTVYRITLPVKRETTDRG